MPKVMKTKGTKRSDKKKNKKSYPKGNLQGKKTAKMGGGTSIRSQPANFARESNPTSRLVKILLKDYIQYKRLYTKEKKEKKHNHATLTQTYLKKRNHGATMNMSLIRGDWTVTRSGIINRKR